MERRNNNLGNNRRRARKEIMMMALAFIGVLELLGIGWMLLHIWRTLERIADALEGPK